MELEEKIKYMRVMGGEDLKDEDEETLSTYLALAQEEILNHIYPYGRDAQEEKLESRFDMKQIELAIILFNDRGAEGEDSHSENGVTRKYTSKEKFLAQIPRRVGF